MDNNTAIIFICDWIVIAITTGNIYYCIESTGKFDPLWKIGSMSDNINTLLNTGVQNWTWDIDTENKTDSWVPVFNGSKIQHRVIPPKLPYFSLYGTTLTITQ